MNAPVRLEIQRGTGDGESHYETYEIDAEASASLLDGLQWIRSHVDPTLAFRFSCINANACKECLMQFDGETVYACVVRPTPGVLHRIEPLPNKTRLRDLISEIAPGKERLAGEGDDARGDEAGEAA
jgi:succinate dehydrogenase / fumarate reductase iron-sulfur subunit